MKATDESEAGVLPSGKLFADMGKYNEELVKAGVLLAAEGLDPSSKGKRVKFSGSKRTVAALTFFRLAAERAAALYPVAPTTYGGAVCAQLGGVMPKGI